MKKNTSIFIVCGIVAVIAIIVIFKFTTKDNTLSKIKYDIVVEEHTSQNSSDESGYSSFYTYVVINSETKEKFVITYQDIWDVHNEKGDVDTISIETKTISDLEVQEAIDDYGKLEKPNKLKNLLDQYIHEEVVINK